MNVLNDSSAILGFVVCLIVSMIFLALAIKTAWTRRLDSSGVSITYQNNKIQLVLWVLIFACVPAVFVVVALSLGWYPPDFKSTEIVFELVMLKDLGNDKPFNVEYVGPDTLREFLVIEDDIRVSRFNLSVVKIPDHIVWGINTESDREEYRTVNIYGTIVRVADEWQINGSYRTRYRGVIRDTRGEIIEYLDPPRGEIKLTVKDEKTP